MRKFEKPNIRQSGQVEEGLLLQAHHPKGGCKTICKVERSLSISWLKASQSLLPFVLSSYRRMVHQAWSGMVHRLAWPWSTVWHGPPGMVWLL
eukprot:1137374-Pelagomonas_calceolata.AAC.3